MLYELRKCVRCEEKWIGDLTCIEVDLFGKPKLPGFCWREDLISLLPEPDFSRQEAVE